MIALVRYTVAVMVHSQRYLPPVLLFVICIGTFAHDAGVEPMVPIFAPMTAVAFVCAAWLTVVLVTAEDPVQRAITTVNAGRSWPQLAAVAVVVLATFAVLSAVLLTLPFVLGNRAYGPVDLIVGAAALLTGACFGIAIGMPTSRLVFRRQGYALLATLVLIMTFLLVRGLPPVNTLVMLLTEERTEPADMLLPELAYLALAVAVLAGSLAATQAIVSRRD
ncbi:MAG TPA: hypothetical protein VH969_00825 [Actinophytocola sp.]|uniref:hypothetical protein n=1 Tax=Actinophytocola sp. TaxID=1872138 RepID=UPI002F92CAAB